MAVTEFLVGQRWISNGEADLGLGLIKAVSTRRITVLFPASGEQRVYASDNAPLSRVHYQVGDQVSTDDDLLFTITAQQQLNGCFIYQGDDAAGNAVSIHEMDLNSAVLLSQPQDRLFAGQIDKNSQFQLRTEALAHRHRLQQSSVLGLMGARVQLLAHQIYIAHQVSQRYAPRVLLADEVGLGKTIEAGLIIHQQLLSERAQRVLIIVPDSLLHQWLVELLRHFNLQFTIIDQARYQALQQSGEADPFASAQLVLSSLSLFTSDPEIYANAKANTWDLLVVDEAHHLQWTPQQTSAEYLAVAGLAAAVPGLLLLTATPEQLGIEGHFSRLRLLDPDRYFDLATFQQQETQYQVVSELLLRLLSSEQAQLATMETELSQYLAPEVYAELLASDDFAASRAKAVNNLLDRHGTGRVLFRNTRDTVKGFANRVVTSYPLVAPERYLALASEAAPLSLLQAESLLGDDWLQLDSRVTWLAQWLAQNNVAKILVICEQATTAEALELYLRIKKGLRTTVFHEGLSLVNRDRAAAYFADQEAGAQLMICSEIGSEGRNFQFSHDLVLFDLPLNPDLLEQRIGRLDRIGQNHDIQIHIPYYQDTAQAVLFNWYHQGLNAFARVLAAGSAIKAELVTELTQCLAEPANVELTQALIKRTQALTQSTLLSLEQGRNRLLELNSCNTEVAKQLLAELEQASEVSALSDFMDKVFAEYGVEQQTHSQDSVIIHPGNQMLQAYFPALPDDGMTATYQRQQALVQEDMAFLTWEHPMVTGCLDMLLTSDFGNNAFCTLEYEGLAAGTLLLEAIFTVHHVAAKSLQVDRYLRHSYLRIVTDVTGHDFNAVLPEALFNSRVGDIAKLTQQQLVKQASSQINQLINQAHKLAATQQAMIIEQALSTMEQILTPEQHRLQALAKVNPMIRTEELSYLEQQQQVLTKTLQAATLTLNAIRIAIVTEP